MARGLNAPVAACALLAALLASLASPAAAQALRDPTRPPGATTMRNAPAQVPSASGGLVLQSVLISEDRRAAVISGQVVTLGEKVDGYELIAVAEAEAVLRGGGETRRLRLYPAVEMKLQETAQAAPASGAAPK